MKSDLNSLIIGEKEFKAITGIELKDIQETIAHEKRTAFQKFQKLILDFWIFLAFSVIFISLLLCPIVWTIGQIISVLLISLELDFSSALRVSAYLSLPISTVVTFSHFSKLKENRKTLKHLRILFDDFDRYNQVIQAIDVKDKLEEVGAVKPDLQGREALLEVLIDMKQDLIRALKVEKILRENQSIIKLNPEMFESSFTATRIRQAIDRGSEYNQLIDTALKIGVSVKTEMNKMKDN